VKALVTGARGQVGTALAAAAPPGWTVTALDRDDLDIGDPARVAAAVAAVGPDLVFNAAAYTAVDRAEAEPDAAFRVNRDGAAHLAAATVRAGARMVHISTDFVFDGDSGRTYRPADETGPRGVYGASKLAGEFAVLAAAPDALIVRTAWVYAASGHNFLRAMLRLMAERGEVRVVADQIGTPTAAVSLADGLWALAGAGVSGVWHYTDAGVASWYDFAVAIGEEASAAGMLACAPRVFPIGTADYPTAARRPAFSVLDKSRTWETLGQPAPHWRDSLRRVLGGMSRSASNAVG
jgi:dTDP-4-dehydrorhamnose reductase